MIKEDIIGLLNTNPKAVERAMVVLYNRQTLDEQRSEITTHRNGRGFNAAHAHLGSYYAKWVISGKHLTGTHLEKARKIALQYAGQLLAIAQEKAQENV